ncbi:hypothetical protein [Gillisia marina]|nr:hypothetical protein [Gillisia marina]
MKFIKTYWLYIVAALITLIGIVTGWYLFIFFAIPFALFSRKEKEE